MKDLDPEFRRRARLRRRRQWMIRKVRGPAHGRDFDREFWQRLGVRKILQAAWEMVLEGAVWGRRKLPSEQEFQRSVVGFQPLPRPVSGRRRLRSDALHRTAVHQRSRRVGGHGAK